MHSDVPAVGSLESSSPLIGKLLHAANHSYLSNLMGYPTDCPQREKNGWTGDGHFAIEAAFYNFDGITVYENGWPTIVTNSSPTECCPILFQLVDGDMVQTTGWTGLVLLPSSLGISTSSTVIASP